MPVELTKEVYDILCFDIGKNTNVKISLERS